MTPSTDRIEKHIELRAPRARVWRALTDAAEFGSWFGARLSGRFAPGARIVGPITTPGYAHLTMDITIERMEPPRLLSWRWHPGALDTDLDVSQDPTTLVVFTLEEIPAGTRLTVVESGFDRLPELYRAKSFGENSEGWAEQLRNIERHVARP